MSEEPNYLRKFVEKTTMIINKANIIRALKKQGLFLAIAIASVFVYACGNKTAIFAWTKLDAINLNTKTNQATTESPLSANEYAIRLQFEIGSLESVSSSGGAIGRASLFNDVIDSLEITSLQDFNETFPRGKILNELFLVRLTSDDIVPLTTTRFIRTRKKEVKDQMDLLLTKSPAKAVPMQFIVKLNLNYSRTLRDTTDAIILK